jgi:hypothetical protein
MSFSRPWHGGWCPPSRFILVPALLLAPFAAAVITDKRIRLLTVFAGMWTLLFSVVFTALPINRFPSLVAGIPGGAFAQLSYRFGIPVGGVFPSLFREEVNDYLLVAVWLSLIAIVLWWAAASSIRTPLPRKFAVLAIAIAAAGFSGRFLYLRQTNAMFRQQIVSPVRELRVEAGSTFEVPVRLTNTGYLRWLASTTYPVTLSYKWVSGGEILPIEGLRTSLPGVIVPGQTTAMNLKAIAPSQAGAYELRVTLVKEGMAWFMAQSGEYLAIRVNIQNRAGHDASPGPAPARESGF